jgi:hypothetical protein
MDVYRDMDFLDVSEEDNDDNIDDDLVDKNFRENEIRFKKLYEIPQKNSKPEVELISFDLNLIEQMINTEKKEKSFLNDPLIIMNKSMV